MGSGNVPREIYIFGILIIYALFGLLYLAMLNTLTQQGTITTCTTNSLEKPDYSVPGSIGSQTSGLFENVFTKINCLPENAQWVNIIFIILTALSIMMIIIVILHG
jgi:hypothetical protein